MCDVCTEGRVCSHVCVETCIVAVVCLGGRVWYLCVCVLGVLGRKDVRGGVCTRQ